MTKHATHNIYLPILDALSASPITDEQTLADDVFSIYRELHSQGFISGEIGPDHLSAPMTRIAGIRITASGRLFREQLIAAKRSAGFWATTWKWLGPVIGFVVGIGTPLLVRWLEQIIGLDSP